MTLFHCNEIFLYVCLHDENKMKQGLFWLYKYILHCTYLLQWCLRFTCNFYLFQVSQHLNFGVALKDTHIFMNYMFDRINSRALAMVW